MKIIVVSTPKKNKTEPEIVTELFNNGLEIFHLRKPKYSERELSDYIRSVPKEHWGKIVIHSHHKLARKFQLKGIHFTKSHRKKKFKTWLTTKRLKYKHPNLQISTSFHSLSYLYEETKVFDYVFISPVFDSISKGGYQSGFSEHSLKEAIKNSEFNIVALGGIELSKVSQLIKMGFYGMALLGTIWSSENPVEDFKKIQQQCNTILHPNKKIHIKPVKIELKTGS